jgi:predicted dehydrogenase
VSALSRSAERASSFAARHGCSGFSAAREFLADPRLDIVSICTPPGEHLQPALQAIAAGKHVLIEKPLEVTLEGCDAIIEAAERKGVRVSGIFQSRFHEGAQLIKRAVDGGRFGRLVLGDACVKWYRTQEYYDQGGWKSLKRHGAGALMNQAIHAIDLLQWFMGPVESVQAFAGTLGHERLEVEDTAVAALRFADGSCGAIEASTAAYPGFLKKIEISGTHGTAVLEEEDLKVWQFEPSRPEDDEIRRTYAQRTRTGGGAADPAAIGLHGHRAQFEDFAISLREGRPPRVNAVEARRAVALILAIYRSIETGKRVRPEA